MQCHNAFHYITMSISVWCGAARQYLTCSGACSADAEIARHARHGPLDANKVQNIHIYTVVQLCYLLNNSQKWTKFNNLIHKKSWKSTEMQYLFTWLIVYGFPQKYMTLKAAGYCAAYKCEFQTSSITQTGKLLLPALMCTRTCNSLFFDNIHKHHNSVITFSLLFS